MKNEFKLPIGYSDHTIGTDVSFAAAIMGANVIEKHFRHPNNAANADDIHALIPSQFEDLIKRVRQIELARGNGQKIPTSSERKNLIENRVSIVSLVDIPAGSKIKKEMIDIRRPGTGLAPKFYEAILNKIIKVDIKSETPLSWNMIEE